MSLPAPSEQGVLLLLQYSYSHMSDAQVEVDDATEDILKNTLHDFITGIKTFDETRQIFLEKSKTDAPVQIANSIMNVSDSPIEQPDETNENSEEPPARRKTRTWTGYEDQRLVAGIFRFGFDSWIRVANFVGGGRTRAQCAQRWTRGLNPKICKKGWSPEEDQQLLNYVRVYGNKSWAKIANLLGNRSDVQCRYHYLQLTNEMKPTSNFIPLGRSQRFLTNSGFIPPGLLTPIITVDNITNSSQTQFPIHLIKDIPPQPIPHAQIQPQLTQAPMQQAYMISTTLPVLQQPTSVHCWDFESNQPGSLDSFLNQMNKPR